MELEFIQWLRERLPADLRAPLGISDDAALLKIAGQQGCVMTVDMLTDGVDFDLRTDAPQRIGRKSLAVNLSDLAAMASRPFAGLIALALPREGALELAKALYEGLIPLAERHRLIIAGGDTNTWDGPLAISVTLVGEVTAHGPLLRSGARPGDAIVVTGSLGGSRLGHQFDFEPRLDEVQWLSEHSTLHAGIDISDGLSLDLWRLCQASGCGAEIVLADVPVSADAESWARQLADGSTPLEHALRDGEDFELLLAVPNEEAQRLIEKQPLACRLTCIGRFVAGSELWQIDASGARVPLEPCGFEH